MRHPFEDRQLTDVEVALWRMRMVAHEAQEILRGFEETGDVASIVNNHLLFAILNHGLLLCAKFIEVWEDFGSLAKSEPRAMLARKAITPLIDRMLVWDGLREYRNTIIAHSYLDKKDQPVEPWDLLQQNKVPTYHAEIILLLQIVHMATCATLMVFSKEYLAITPLFSPMRSPPTASPGIALGIEIVPTLAPLITVVTINLTSSGVAWVPLIATEFKNAVVGS